MPKEAKPTKLCNMTYTDEATGTERLCQGGGA